MSFHSVSSFSRFPEGTDSQEMSVSSRGFTQLLNNAHTSAQHCFGSQKFTLVINYTSHTAIFFH